MFGKDYWQGGLSVYYEFIWIIRHFSSRVWKENLSSPRKWQLWFNITFSSWVPCLVYAIRLPTTTAGGTGSVKGHTADDSPTVPLRVLRPRTRPPLIQRALAIDHSRQLQREDRNWSGILKSSWACPRWAHSLSFSLCRLSHEISD